MIAGTLEIQLLANMARLQTDMDKAKRTVSSAVDAMNRALGVIGVGVSLAGIASMIKSVVDVGDKLNDLRKITGLTVNELGGLDKQAKLNGTNLDSVAKAIGIMSKNMYTGVDAFKLLGIATKDADGNLRNANQVLLDVADRFSRMQDGAQKSAIANQIFGKSGRELIPLLNEGRVAMESAAEAHRKYSGVTQASAEASDVFNDNLTLLGGRVTAIKTSFVGELLPTLNAISTAMLNSGQSTNQFSFAANVVVPVLKGLAIAGAAVVGIFQGVGREIGAAAAQMAAIARFDFNGVAVISKALAEDHKKADAAFDKYVKTILNSDNVVQQANVSQQKMIDLQVQIPNVTDKAAKAIERKTKAYDIEIYKLKQYEDLYKKGRDLTERVATSQERYNNELRELEALRPYITVETYNRALEKAQKELKGTEVQTRQTTDAVSQLWMQAGRNIQSTLANSIFNFFDDGLKGMLKNVVSTVGRIASEFAALKLAQSIGLAGMFGGTGSALSGGVGGTGGLSAALSGASLLSGASNLFKTGFGTTSLLSGAGSLLPGSTGAFFSGMGGGAVAGVSSPAALAGSSFAAAAGPAMGVAMAALALDSMSNAFAGDKTIGGGFGKFMQKIPVLGAGWDILAGLFGHGPMKFRQQSIQGTASSSGFDGDITNVFRAKGGLFVGNKHKSVTEQLSDDQQKLFDQTIKGFFESTHNFAENLGLSTELVDNYTQQIQIKSEKGKKLTEEAITEMIQGIGDGLAKTALPSLDEFRKSGETSFTTLSRLSAEFDALDSGAVNLGYSVAYANDLIKSMSISARSAFVDMAGGIENLGSLTTYFADNYLSQAERITPVITNLTEAAKDLGFAYTTDVTREQVKALIQSQNISAEARIGLLKLLPTFDLVKNTLDSIYGNGNKAADSLNDFASNLQSIKSDLASTYQNERNGIESTISKFKDLAGQLRGFSDSLSLGTLSPLTPAQKLDESRNQFNQVRSAAAGGDQNALAQLPSVAQDFLTASQTYNASGAAYLSDFSMVQSVLADAEESALSQIDIAQSQLTALDDSVKYLISIKDSAKTTNELLTDLKIAVLSSAGNPAISTSQIQSFLSANPGMTPDQVANSAVQYGVSGTQLSAAGYDVAPINQAFGGSSISDAQILEVWNSGASPLDMYNAAVRNGISSQRVAAVTGTPIEDIQKWVKDNNLPSFAKGTDFVAKSGLAMIHRAEAIVPSSTTDEIKKLREELAALRAEQNQQTGDMIKVISITNKQNAEIIAKSNKDVSKDQQWSDRSKAALA